MITVIPESAWALFCPACSARSRGTLREPVRIASRGRAEVQVPAELSFSRLSAPMRSVIEMGSFNYRITGTLSIQEPRPTTAPFSQTGNVSVLGNH